MSVLPSAVAATESDDEQQQRAGGREEEENGEKQALGGGSIQMPVLPLAANFKCRCFRRRQLNHFELPVFLTPAIDPVFWLF